jgi:hypothetical protein
MRWAIILTATLASVVHAAATDVISEASGAGLQADAKRAVQLLQDIDVASLSEKDRKFVSCMRERFGSSSPPAMKKPRNFTDRALAIYQAYWHAALTKPGTREKQEKWLDASLRKLLKAPKSADVDSMLEKRIEADGKHSLEGRTGLLRELMIWNKQDEKQEPVALPEGEYRVKVVLLDGFESFGWSYYATCGRRATGGWTTDDALYAVVPRYDSLDEEEFRVTFLGHESQHFADKARFKDLKPWELEYRAKLTELALADTTRTKVLSKFIEDQGNDPASPHSYADRAVLAALASRLSLKDSNELFSAPPDQLRTAARQILLDDSARRQPTPGSI